MFWNKPCKMSTERPSDPLGLDTLREAMADVLVPSLSARTKYAEDYLWILLGLKWARAEAGSPLDADIWRHFARFERALKQYWFKLKIHPDFQGKREVTKRCENRDRPDLETPILLNERNTGMLGAYIVSLRSIGLIEEQSLALTKSGERLVDGLEFSLNMRDSSSWAALARCFKAVRFGNERFATLGRTLFSGSSPSMKSAALACRKRPSAADWVGLVGSGVLSSEQKIIARAANPTVLLERSMREGFAELLEGERKMGAGLRATMTNRARKLLSLKASPWKFDDERWIAMDACLRALASGRSMEAALFDLHVTVAKDFRGNPPWLSAVGGPSSEIAFEPEQRKPDYRFRNLRRLVQQTRWRA